jgi:hypothetical protein
MPDTYEVTYVRRADHTFSATDRVYPREFDRPCSDMAADYYLGALGLLRPKQLLGFPLIVGGYFRDYFYFDPLDGPGVGDHNP